MRMSVLVPDSEVLLLMAPEELAGVLIVVFLDQEKVHLTNFVGSVADEYPQLDKHAIFRAIAEAVGVA